VINVYMQQGDSARKKLPITSMQAYSLARTCARVETHTHTHTLHTQPRGFESNLLLAMHRQKDLSRTPS